MSDFSKLIDNKLDEIMIKYNCDHPIEALILYLAEYEEELIKELKIEGKNIKEELEKFDKEVRSFEISCLTDPEKAEANNRVLMLLKDYYDNNCKNIGE